jgi:hypothetical protein
MRVTLFIHFLLAGCCLFAAQTSARDPGFSAQDFFNGRTEGNGELKIIFSRRKAVHVDGTGRIAAEGELILDQVVTEEGTGPRKREWRIREVSQGHYVGRLSDAIGPVVGDVAGQRLHLRFRMEHGLRADQVLDLSSDRQSVHNRMTVRKFGMVVARLDETIRKVGS